MVVSDRANGKTALRSISESGKTRLSLKRSSATLSLMIRFRILWPRIISCLLLTLSAAFSSRADSPKDFSANGWDAFVAKFLDEYFVAHPDSAISAGRHEFDGQLPDLSEAGLKQEIARLEKKRQEA